MPPTRRNVLRSGLLGAAGVSLAMTGAGCRRPRGTRPDQPFQEQEGSRAMNTPAGNASAPDQGRMPVLFIGHGSPMNAIEDNTWSRGFRELAGLLPKPKAILSVSAHWYVRGTFLTGNDKPETIHD